MFKWGIGAATAALAAAFAGGSASAQVYIAGGAGWNELDSVNSRTESGISPGVPLNMVIDVDGGISANGAVGIDLGALRIEGEYRYSTSDTNNYQAKIGSGVIRQADGNVVTQSAMANVYYDFDGGGFSPFLGVGIGPTKADVELSGPSPLAPNGPVVSLVDTDETNIGWQAMAGFSVPLMPNTALTAQFRYYDDGTFDMRDTNGRTMHLGIKGHSFDVGLRYSF